MELEEHVEAAGAASDLAAVLPTGPPGPWRGIGPSAPRRSTSRAISSARRRRCSPLPPDYVGEDAVDRIQAAVRELDSDQLDPLLPPGTAADLDERAGPILAELALARALADDMDGAMVLARRADSVGVSGRADSVVAALFAEDLSPLVPSVPVIGALLPLTGSPTNQEYASLFMEGIEVALELAGRDSTAVEFVSEDNRGTISGTERGLSALEGRGAVAVLGPLLDENLAVAGESRGGRLALLSPTARVLPSETDAVYSMAMVDPGAARILAETVSDLGFTDAVVVHPRSTERTEEALAFEASFLELGGLVRSRLEYDPGTTYFEEALLQVESLQPELLVLAIPASDIQLLAPQVAFFGLDTLGIQVAGTAGWVSENALGSVEQRHTNRVIAVSPSPPGLASDLTQVFVDTYETRFRKTLRSLVPAVAFDMFRLVLSSYRLGVRTPGDFVHNLEEVRQFEGVTGTYSVLNGEIVRDFFPVRIFEGQVLPIDAPLPEPPGP